jgi:hypothetical protein
MKFRTIFNLTILFAITAVFATSCVKEEFDVPPINIPHFDQPSNLTILQLKAGFSGNLDALIGDSIIEGIVVANDESGNIYKALYIQDGTAGIEVRLDRTDMYNEFKIGQRVFIKCKGLYLGKYGDVTQLGYIYNSAIGRIPDAMIDQFLFRDSLPGAEPTPLSRTITTLSGNDMSMLIQIDNVHFQEPGAMFSPILEDSQDRLVIDDDGNTLIVRTSGYANFAKTAIPNGKGSIRGVLGSYNGDYQFYIRSMNDLVNWDTTAAFPQDIINETFDATPTGWSIVSKASNKNWEWSATYLAMVANGFGADVASDDWLISPAINLTGVTGAILNFRSWTKFTDGGEANPMKVKISTDFTGDPATATWTTLTVTLSPTGSQTWTASGDIDLSAYSGNVYIAFHYISSGTASGSTSQWEIDEFKVKGVQ